LTFNFAAQGGNVATKKDDTAAFPGLFKAFVIGGCVFFFFGIPMMITILEHLTEKEKPRASASANIPRLTFPVPVPAGKIPAPKRDASLTAPETITLEAGGSLILHGVMLDEGGSFTPRPLDVANMIETEYSSSDQGVIHTGRDALGNHFLGQLFAGHPGEADLSVTHQGRKAKIHVKVVANLAPGAGPEGT